MATLCLAITRKNLSFSQVEWKRAIPLKRPPGNKPPTPTGSGS